MDPLKQSPVIPSPESNRSLPSVAPRKSPSPTSADPGKDQAKPYLKIAHILFVDMVGYSRMEMESQAAVQVELQSLVQRTEAVREAHCSDTLICRPTGDGMALLFFNNPLSPVNCALQIDRFLREEEEQIVLRTNAQIKLRMGLHSGPVLMVVDVNDLSDVAGEGIVIAQRIMDCGDAGHILLSQEMAQILTRIAPWHRYIHDIGTCRVKHGTVIHLFNLYGTLNGTLHGSVHGQAFGSAKIPRKVSSEAADRVEKALLAREKKPPRFTVWQPFLNFVSMVICAAVAATIVGVLWAKSPEFRSAVRDIPRLKDRPIVGTDSIVSTAKNDTPVYSERITSFLKKPEQAKSGRPGNGAKIPIAYTRDPVSTSMVQVQVPNFIGLTFEDAERAADEAGIMLRISDKSTITIEQPEGHIYLQTHPAGTWIRDDNKPFYVRVSLGLLEPEITKERLTRPKETPPAPEPSPEGEGAAGGRFRDP